MLAVVLSFIFYFWIPFFFSLVDSTSNPHKTLSFLGWTVPWLLCALFFFVKCSFPLVTVLQSSPLRSAPTSSIAPFCCLMCPHAWPSSQHVHFMHSTDCHFPFRLAWPKHSVLVYYPWLLTTPTQIPLLYWLLSLLWWFLAENLPKEATTVLRLLVSSCSFRVKVMITTWPNKRRIFPKLYTKGSDDYL